MNASSALRTPGRAAPVAARRVDPDRSVRRAVHPVPGLRRLIPALCACAFALTPALASAAVYTVTKNTDSGPNVSGELRAALVYANAHPGTTIQLNFSGPPTYPNGAWGAAWVVTLTQGSLPTITAAGTVIDGFSQPNHPFPGALVLDGHLVPSQAVAPFGDGITLSADGCTVQGLAIISFNSNGITVNSSYNYLFGNFVGINPITFAKAGNAFNGLKIQNDADHNDIFANSIGGNLKNGVLIQNADYNYFHQNRIGTDVNEWPDFGNVRYGMLIGATSRGNIIGGPSPALNSVDPNIIKNNGWGAIVVSDATNVNYGNGNTIGQNYIYNNQGMGINLQYDTDPGGQVTANDPGDGDNGPNGFQNFPVIQSALANPKGGFDVAFSLNSHPDSAYRVDLYLNSYIDPVVNPNVQYQAQQYIGSVELWTDGSGDASDSFFFYKGGAGLYITALATDESTGDTSELSAPVAVQ